MVSCLASAFLVCSSRAQVPLGSKQIINKKWVKTLFCNILTHFKSG